jgi:hypothetical protein
MIKKSFAFAALAALSISSSPAAMAGANDYEFQPVSTEIKNGVGADGLPLIAIPGIKLEPGRL